LQKKLGGVDQGGGAAGLTTPESKRRNWGGGWETIFRGEFDNWGVEKKKVVTGGRPYGKKKYGVGGKM